jgi:tryptophan synthase alpha chain
MSDAAAAITTAIVAAEGQAIGAYLTAGYPTPDGFSSMLEAVSVAADVVEVGIPFSDPMADGLTIQHASQVALRQGAHLEQIFEILDGLDLAAPHVMMGYYNPFLAYGPERLVERMASVGTAGLIVPDLPMEESRDIAALLETKGLALIQLVAPTTPPERMRALAGASRGFVYAVTAKGTTGRATRFDPEVLDYLDLVKSVSDLPVLAGFGVRERSQVVELAGHVDGVVVGSALIDAIDAGQDPALFLEGLRPVGVTS